MTWIDFNKEVNSRGLAITGPLFGKNYFIIDRKTGLPKSGGAIFCNEHLSIYSEDIGSNDNYINSVQYFINKLGEPSNIFVRQQRTGKAGNFINVETIEWEKGGIKYTANLTSSIPGYISGGASIGFDSSTQDCFK